MFLIAWGSGPFSGTGCRNIVRALCKSRAVPFTRLSFLLMPTAISAQISLCQPQLRSLRVARETGVTYAFSLIIGYLATHNAEVDGCIVDGTPLFPFGPLLCPRISFFPCGLEIGSHTFHLIPVDIRYRHFNPPRHASIYIFHVSAILFQKTAGEIPSMRYIC